MRVVAESWIGLLDPCPFPIFSRLMSIRTWKKLSQLKARSWEWKKLDCGVSELRARATSPRVCGGGWSGKPKLFAVEVWLPDETKTSVSTGRALCGGNGAHRPWMTRSKGGGVGTGSGRSHQHNDKRNDGAPKTSQLTPTRLPMKPQPHQRSNPQCSPDPSEDKSSAMCVEVGLSMGQGGGWR